MFRETRETGSDAERHREMRRHFVEHRIIAWEFITLGCGRQVID